MQIAKEKILIADGEETIREMVSRIVNQSGFEAVTVKQAKQALEVLKSMPFILLIADLKLPGMGGLELIKAARSENPDLHAICMTDSLQDYIDLIASGASDYITKPFTVGEMKAKLDRVNRERSLIRDLTQKSVELERLNEELKRLDQLKSTFISSISHELRTPLTVIKEFVSLMIEGHVGPITDDQKEYLGIANKNVLRLTNLIETLLDFSRIESGKRLKLRFEPVRLIEVVEDAAMTISQQLEEKRITLENRIDPDAPPVLIDRKRMAEVLINLIGNGIKFTPAGGKVAVDLRGLTEKRDYLKVVVSDTGVGIAAEDLPKIFGRFYQGQKTEAGLITGTGLGLAITKEIIEGHKGDIRPESGAGGGSSFVFTLPIFGISTLYSLILDPMFEEAEQDKLPLSLTRVEFWDQRAGREVALNRDSWESVVYALQKLVRSVDVIIPFQNRVVYIFSFIASKMAREIGERIQVKLTLGGYLPKGIEVRFKSFSHPGEALTKEDFLKGCRLLLKED